MYWDFILRYETPILIFVHAHRKNFVLYVEVLEILTPLFFALIFEDECLFPFEIWKFYLAIIWEPWTLSFVQNQQQAFCNAN